MRWLLGSTSLFMFLSIGCGGDEPTADEETGTAGTADTGESGSMTGDGDGDTNPGDGDGDPGDGDGDACPVGAEGCPCTPGGGCDPGLMCDAGVCVPASGDGDGDGDPTGDGDGDGDPTGDGDGDGDPSGDGDGDGDMPYGACPNGVEDCAPGEVCVVSNNMFNTWSLCTVPCQDQDDCAYDDLDGCADLPGDGVPMNYCSPVLDCADDNPCPMGMECYPPFMGQIDVCLWPGN
jgi:hypothetical protein